MDERLITHLRHVDLAVPDYDRQLEFYTSMWGLTPEVTDNGIAFLAAEGSPEQYSVRLRRAGEKRLDLIAFGAATPADVDTLAARLGSGGVRLVTEPGKLQTPGGGYGFRFFDNDGRTIEVSCDVTVRAHRKVEEKPPSRSTSDSSDSRCPTRSPRRTWARSCGFCEPTATTTAWHLYDFSDPMVTDQWGTANPMNEFVARQSFNDPDRGVFIAPPV